MEIETVSHNGQTLRLTQEPYIDFVQRRIGDTVEVIDGTVYRAVAEDAEGNQYSVYWTKLDKNNEVRDWNNYIVCE